METYVRDLANYLSKASAPSNKFIVPAIEGSDVRLAVTQAIPCALAMNELISNAFKAAFKDREEGRIQISMQKSNDNTVRIRIRDNRVGIPEEIDIDSVRSLGLKLVRNLVRHQLRGDLRFRNDNGADILITFKTSGDEGKHGKILVVDDEVIITMELGSQKAY